MVRLCEKFCKAGGERFFKDVEGIERKDMGGEGKGGYGDAISCGA